MREKIERLSNEIFEYDNPSILLSQEELGIVVVAGTIYKGSFTIKNNKNAPMKGVLYSSSKFLKLQSDKFTGEEASIDYEFHGTTLNQGEIIKGFITIVSNLSEVRLPFTATLETPYFESSLGKLKDLYSFTNLAKTDIVQGLKLFRHKDFPLVFLQHEDNYKALYYELLKSRQSSSAMEEFLIAIHKKLPVNISVDRYVLSYDVTDESFKDKITITKDNWGYGEYKISCDSDFITLDHKIIWTENFIANQYFLEFILHPENMRCGNNFGKITIKSTHQVISIDVICKYKKSEDKRIYPDRNIKKLEVKIIRNYLDFRKNRIPFHEYLEEGRELLTCILQKDVPYRLRYELMRIHLLIASDEEDTARYQLKEFIELNQDLMKLDAVAYCGYEYLMALLYKDDETLHQTLLQVRSLYEKENFHYSILWILLHIDKKYDRNKNAKLQDIKVQFDNGCTSPILYFEAATIYNNDPSLLHELGKFEISVLYWSIREEYMSQDVASQYLYLANKLKGFHYVVYKTLVCLYESLQMPEALFSICSLLIKGHKKGQKYYYWFDQGVQKRLRITELYEYYMYSIDEKNDFFHTEFTLPQPILLYFIYNSNISDKKKAFLYEYIIKNKDKLSNIYRTYYKKMELFALKQMAAKNISIHLSTIYQEFIGKEELMEEIKKSLPAIMFCYQIECRNPNMKGVYIVHEELEETTFTPFINGVAIVTIFTEHYQIILCDYNDNRYAATADYTLYKLMPWEDYIGYYKEDLILPPMVLLNIFDKVMNYQKYDPKAITLRKEILEIPGLSFAFKTKNLLELINYYYDNYDEELLDYYLAIIELDELAYMDKGKVIDLYIVRDMYDKAAASLCQYGFDGIDIDNLIKFCIHFIQKSNNQSRNKEFLIQLAFHIFKEGSYNEEILKFLTSHYYGTSSDMFVLWEVANSYNIDIIPLEERLLGQMLFAESYIVNSISVFLSYYKNGSNKKLIRAFLSFQAYKYLLNGRIMNKELFEIMKNETLYEEHDVCMLALMKYYSLEDILTETEIEFIDYNMHKYMNKGILLPFFKNFKHYITLPSELKDKHYVEYHTNPSHKVRIHYRIKESANKGAYAECEMKHMYIGLFVKDFILFSGEKLDYYITEENESGERFVTENVVVSLDDEVLIDRNTKYNHINYMIEALEMKDDKTLIDSIESFMNQKYIIEEVFKPI